MTTGLYIVRRGDTLTKIAKAHGTTPQEVADLNHLTNLDLIRVGQKLFMPPPSKTTASPVTSAADVAGELWFQFKDAANKPIVGLKVFVTGLEKEFEHVTDAMGKIPVLPVMNHDTPVSVSVEKVGKGRKDIANFKATTGAQSVLISSPKIKVKSVLQLHQGEAAGTMTPATQRAGTVTDTHSAAGHPVKRVALECPNKCNLSLGLNSKYRDILLSASSRSGFPPQAIAALLDAEAAPVVQLVATEVRGKGGNPVLDPKTGQPMMRTRRHITGEWDANSKNRWSSARGVSQVLDETWIGLALTEGTFLNVRARKEGWITTATMNKRVGHILRNMAVPAFRLCDGTLVTKVPLLKTLSHRPYLTGRALASDKNLQNLLDLRFDVECAIHTAVDYGRINLRELSCKGYLVRDLNDGEKAKIMYLCHHLGSGDACKFIDDTMTSDHALYLLKTQLGSEQLAAKKAIEAGGSPLQAHREWLSEFIDRNIKVTNHMCDQSVADKVRKLIPITKIIRRT